MSVSWEPRALPVGLHEQKGHEDFPTSAGIKTFVAPVYNWEMVIR